MNPVPIRPSRLKAMLKAVLPPIVVDVAKFTLRRGEHDRSAAQLQADNFTLRELGSQSPTLLLLNDCSDQANYGAEGLMEGLIRIFKAAIPEHTLRLLPSHWLIDPDPNWFEAFYNGTSLVQPPAIWPEVADQFDYIADEWLAGRGGPGVDAYLKALHGVDIVILNGEGSMYRTNLSAIRELFLAWFAKARLGIPTIFINGLVHLTLVVPILPAMMRKTFRVLERDRARPVVAAERAGVHAGDSGQARPGLGAGSVGRDRQPQPWREVAIQTTGGQGVLLFRSRPDAKRSSFRPAIVDVSADHGDQEVGSAGRDGGERSCRKTAAQTVGHRNHSIYLELQPSYRDLMAVLARTKFQISGRNHNPVLGALSAAPRSPSAPRPIKSTGSVSCWDSIHRMTARTYVRISKKSRLTLPAIWLLARRSATRSEECGWTGRRVAGNGRHCQRRPGKVRRVGVSTTWSCSRVTRLGTRYLFHSVQATSCRHGSG